MKMDDLFCPELSSTESAGRMHWMELDEWACQCACLLTCLINTRPIFLRMAARKDLICRAGFLQSGVPGDIIS